MVGSLTPNAIAAYRVHDRTHYADLLDSEGNPLLQAQLRCTIQSIMNTEKPSVAGEPVAMPEMQFFGLPADTINKGNDIATITYLKAEDADGNIHDILGRHQKLPYKEISGSNNVTSTIFRIYFGDASYIATNNNGYSDYFDVYFDAYTLDGTKRTNNQSYLTINISDGSDKYYDFSAYDSYQTSVAYYELYLYSADNEKIIISSGYAGGQQ